MEATFAATRRSVSARRWRKDPSNGPCFLVGIVAHAPRGARVGKRARFAPRDAGDADRRAEIHERLRGCGAERLTGTPLYTLDVHVDRQDLFVEREAANGGGRVGADTGQLDQMVGPTFSRDFPCCTMKVQRTPVVAEPLPLTDHIRRRGGRKRLDGRPALEPGQVARDHPLDLRLLEHDLRDEDRVGITGSTPGKVAAMAPRTRREGRDSTPTCAGTSERPRVRCPSAPHGRRRSSGR